MMRHRFLPLLIAGSFLFASPLRGQDVPPLGGEPDTAPESRAPRIEGGSIPVRLVEGRMVAACDISTNFRRIPVNLLIEYDGPWGLRLHNQATGGIRAERNGVSVPVTIHFPGLEIVVPAREHGPEELYNDFTKYHSKEMGENALVGSIGAEVLSRYHVTFDIEAGFIHLEAPRERAEESPAAVEGREVLDATVHNKLVWISVRMPDGSPMAMAIGSSTYDTIVDEDLVYDLGYPAGNVGPVHAGTINLSEIVAFRPEELMQVHADGAFGVTGINLLRNFRIGVDLVNRRVEFDRVLTPEYPEVDFQYFDARAQEAPEPIEAFLTDHADSRLAREAARELVDLRLSFDDTGEGFKRAIEWVTNTALDDLRSTTALDLMEDLLESGYPEQALLAGESGVPFGRDDRYPNAVHSIHARLGEQYLEKDSRRKAWKHLLSAAFGLPEDGRINLNLARFYELEGRYNRAYSRYVQAVITPEAGPQALEGLERVHPHLGETESMSVDTVAELIAGKTLNFGAATKFKATEENSSNRVVLLEFFTNAHGRGTLAGELAWDGLISHFPYENVAFVSYHLGQPELEPLVNPIGDHYGPMYSVTRPTLVVDGKAKGPGAARTEQREALYNHLKDMVLTRLTEPAMYEVKATAEWADGRVQGRVTVNGPELDDLSVQILLVERGVLFPGKNKHVVHRMVARSVLTDSLHGVSFAPIADEMIVEFDRSLATMTAANIAYLDTMQAQGGGMVTRFPARIDPRQLSVVAFIRSDSDGQVLQAVQVDLPDPEEAKVVAPPR